MTQEEYFSIDWKRGNMVRLTNGKEYMVRAVKKKCLLLHSNEYYAYFVVDYRIIDCRTSDAVEKKKEEQPYQYKPRQQYNRPQNNRYQRPQYGNGRNHNNSYRGNQYRNGNSYRNNRYGNNQYGDNQYRNARFNGNAYGDGQYQNAQREQNGYGNAAYDNRYENRWNNGNANLDDANRMPYEQQPGYQPEGFMQRNSTPAMDVQPATNDAAAGAADMADAQATTKRKRQRVVIRKTTAEKVEYKPRNSFANPINPDEQQ